MSIAAEKDDDVGELSFFERTLQGSIYEQYWKDLDAELIRVCDPETPLQRLLYPHMDHGPRHWKKVASNCEKLWELACNVPVNHSWTAKEIISESSFLLIAAAHLHDIGMICGHDFFFPKIDLDESEQNEFKRITKIDISKETTLSWLAATTPLGQFYIRKNQSLLASRYVDYLKKANRHRDKTPIFQSLPNDTVTRLKFLLEHYGFSTAFTDVERDRIALQIDFQECGGRRILALAAILLFGDWAHADQTRLPPGMLDKLCDTSNQELANALTDDKPFPVDGGPSCWLPKMFRSHYVCDAEINWLEPVTDGRFEFSIRLGRPWSSRMFDVALKTLVREWKSKLFPSRMEQLIASDRLDFYAKLSLEYDEPYLQEPGKLLTQTRTSFLPPPPVVVDYWIASNWFNLEEDAQFYSVDALSTSLSNETLETIDKNTIFNIFDPKSNRRKSPKPRLRRRAFLYIHLYYTNGLPMIAENIFARLCYDICSSFNPEAGRQLKMFLEHAALNVKQRFMEVLVGPPSNEEMRKMRNFATAISKAWREAEEEGIPLLKSTLSWQFEPKEELFSAVWQKFLDNKAISVGEHNGHVTFNLDTEQGQMLAYLANPKELAQASHAESFAGV